MLLQGMVGGWEVIEASHTVSSGLNVTCHMLNSDLHHGHTNTHIVCTHFYDKLKGIGSFSELGMLHQSYIRSALIKRRICM